LGFADFNVGSFFCYPRAQMVLNLYSLFCKNPAKGQIFVSQRSFCAPRVLNIIFFRRVGNLWASDMMSAGAKHHNLAINKEGA
jgi:hypothetical protein